MSVLQELRKQEVNTFLGNIKMYFELLVNRNVELQGEDRYEGMLEICVDTMECVVINTKIFGYITTGEEITVEKKNTILDSLIELEVISNEYRTVTDQYLEQVIKVLHNNTGLTKEFINDFVIKGTAFINIVKEI